MEKRLENLIQETTDSEKPSEGVGLEMCHDEAQSLAEELSNISDLLNHDEPIKSSDIESLKNLAKGLVINIEGELMSVEDAEEISDLKDQIQLRNEIREKIKKGVSHHHNSGEMNMLVGKIKYLTFFVAEALSHYEGALHLGIKEIEGKSAEHLSKCVKGFYNVLWLTNLTSISEQVAEHLGNHQNALVVGLEELSDGVAERLAQHKGGLEIRKLSSITEMSAKYLSQLKSGLQLPDLAHISDEVAKNLCVVGEGLTLNNKDGVPLSDEAIKYLATHKGSLTLYNIGTLSDKGANLLSKHNGRIHLSIDSNSLSKKGIEALKKHPDLLGSIMINGSSKNFRDL